MKAIVYVTLKSGVLDPQGQAVHKTLGRLGYDEVGAVRVGKYIEIALDESDPARARERVDAMCRELLANPVIEDFRVEVEA
ncbi:phosphoribosylformylglycinamidine synthase subunit PurS [Haliangium sp.]|uniref:phosphoribosylformylglycinamidine synthase subunit PurS n=1 Tax=Haliangium sp. TaxID=2663208 RepID=UPI003D107584